MKIGILGDTHFTNRAPERRLDNYSETQMRKSGQAFDIFESNHCDCVIQPGDFCDSPTIANRVKSEIIRFLDTRNIKVYCTWGQHDVSGHSKFTLPNSPLEVLQAAGVVKIVGDKPEEIGTVSFDDNTPVYLYGAGFGEPIPEPFEDSYNILVAHIMIGDRELWPGQVLSKPRSFLRKNPGYDTCILGDYHYKFVEQWNGRTVMNMGALVRQTINKFDLEHKPSVGVFDTTDNKLEIFELDIEPPEKVFDLCRKLQKKDNKMLAELVESLKRLKRGGHKLVGWKHFLVKLFEERQTNQEVKDVIDEALEEIK